MKAAVLPPMRVEAELRAGLRRGFQAELGAPWFGVSGVPVYERYATRGWIVGFAKK